MSVPEGTRVWSTLLILLHAVGLPCEGRGNSLEYSMKARSIASVGSIHVYMFDSQNAREELGA
jgi:hypothetical protein